MPDRAGQRLGNYRLTRLLGQGSFADVYLGEHIHLKTKAAIKVLAMRLVSRNMQQFLSEAQTIAGLVHPNIVRVLEFGIEDDMPFMVMDYAPNGTLRQCHPKGTPLSPVSIVPYVKQVAAALQYAHDRKLIHRDIKPENMLLGSNNDVLLSDFGLALIAQSTEVQSTQAMAGTLPYMAPEQFRGKPRPASDQYALGIVVYEWLSGDRPFHGPFAEIASQHMLVPPPPLLEKVPTISSAIQEVVQIALAKDPHQRFASVQAFATAFEQACQEKQTRLLVSPIVASAPSQSLQPVIPELVPPSQRLTVPEPLPEPPLTGERSDAVGARFIAPGGGAIRHDKPAPPLAPTAKLADIGFTSIPTWPPVPSGQPDKKPSPFRWLKHSRKTPLPSTSLGQPRRRWLREPILLTTIFILIAAMLLMMSGVFAFQLLALPTVSIHFSPQTHLVSQTVQITASTSVTGVDVGSRSIPAKIFSESKTASETGPTSGQSTSQPVVSESDVYTLAVQIRPNLESQIVHDLQKQLQALGATQLGTVQLSYAIPTVKPPVGSPSKTVTVTLTAQGRVGYFLNRDAQTLARQLLLRQMQTFGANYIPVDSTIRIGQPVVSYGSKSAIINIPAAGYAEYQFSQAQLDQIKDQIKEKTVSSARSFIAIQAGVDPKTISIRFRSAGSNRIPSNGDTLPADPQLIMLTPDPVTPPPVQLPTPAPTDNGNTSLDNGGGPFFP